MKEIISRVQSPFTDEKIKELIEQYIAWDGDFSGLYRKINGVDFSKTWNNVISDKNYLRKSSNEKTELYRIYLNLKGEDKSTVVQAYVQQCEAINKGYKLKYSAEDGNDDEIVITTDAENLKIDIDIIEQVTEGMKLEQLSPLVGVYENSIGIIEEYAENPIYSYTETRLDMIPKAIVKYIFDNSVEFIEYCNDRQVKLIADTSEFFKKYAENIALGYIGYGMHIVVVKELMNPLREYMADNSQKALPEMVANFRAACRVHGISKQGVFSLSTEQKVEVSQNSGEIYEKTLEGLQQELEKLMKQERRTTQKREETKLLRNAYQAELDRKETSD